MGGGQSLADRGRSGSTGPPRRPNPGITPPSTPESRTGSVRGVEGLLSGKETELILKTWVIMNEDIVGNGVRVFLRINLLEPSIIQAFPFRDLPADDLPKSSLFRGHASRFMKAVEVTLNNLGALEVIVIPNLIHLGRAHARIRGFKVEYLQVFQRAMMEIWAQELGRQFRGECKEGWGKIFSFITAKVLEGYEQGLREMEQDSDPSTRRSLEGISPFRFPLTETSNKASPGAHARRMSDKPEVEGCADGAQTGHVLKANGNNKMAAAVTENGRV